MAEKVLSETSLSIASYIAKNSSCSEGTTVQFKLCKSLQYGELYIPGGVGSVVKEAAEKAGAHLIPSIPSEAGVHADATKSDYFQKVVFNPQGHLCLSLNRPLTFANCIQEILIQGQKYGCIVGETTNKSVTIAVDSFVSQKGDAGGACKEKTSYSQLTVMEGRLILLMGLLSKLLKTVGHPVKCFGSAFLCSREVPSADDPAFPVWRLCHSFTTDMAVSVTDFTDKSFLSSLLTPFFKDGSDRSFAPESNCQSSSEVNTSSSGITSTTVYSRSSFSEASDSGCKQGPSEVAMLKGALVDAKKFLQLHSLSGKGGYDKNIDKIQVTGEEGSLTPVGTLGFQICKLMCEGKADMVVHIAHHQKSFAIQQAMALSEIWIKRKAIPCCQHILLTSGVEHSAGGRQVKTCTLAELMRVRLHQMTEAYLIKYGETAKGPRLQEIAMRMAEAVVKFEMLSANPKATVQTVKIELPVSASDPGMKMESDVRFAGAFVLYNYARLATLFAHFERACKNGVYPRLPDVTKVDFSLLKEEEEWELLFHYVLQYPLVVKEAASLKKNGIGIHVDIAVKKICLFLTKLGHAFSSYYSRVKVLMTAEPHLIPLVHARLYLMAAVKQVMYNGLTVLAIEPLEQL